MVKQFPSVDAEQKKRKKHTQGSGLKKCVQKPGEYDVEHSGELSPLCFVTKKSAI